MSPVVTRLSEQINPDLLTKNLLERDFLNKKVFLKSEISKQRCKKERNRNNSRETEKIK